MAKIHLNNRRYFSTTGKSTAFAVVIILSHAISPNPNLWIDKATWG
jgi:hypothetical protein